MEYYFSDLVHDPRQPCHRKCIVRCYYKYKSINMKKVQVAYYFSDMVHDPTQRGH